MKLIDKPLVPLARATNDPSFIFSTDNIKEHFAYLKSYPTKIIRNFVDLDCAEICAYIMEENNTKPVSILARMQLKATSEFEELTSFSGIVEQKSFCQLVDRFESSLSFYDQQNALMKRAHAKEILHDYEHVQTCATRFKLGPQSHTRTVTNRIEVKALAAIKKVCFEIAPFVGFEKRRYDLRLSVDNTDPECFTLSIENWDDIKSKVQDEILRKISDATQLSDNETWVGSVTFLDKSA